VRLFSRHADRRGDSIAYLKNSKGVVIKLHLLTGGLRFNLSANGIHVTLEQS
jgi:hypothetical protein